MSSWFSQIRSLLKLESNPSKVIEVKQEKYSDRKVERRGTGINLYGKGGKDQEVYDVVLLRPSNENLGAAFR